MSDVVPRGPGDGPLTRRRFLELAALAVPAGAVLAACASGGSTGHGSTSGFPIGAAARASQKPVPVTMWHSMSSQNLVTLTHLTAQFNASQQDVKVSLVAQSGYPATLSAYTAALSGGQLPDLVQIATVDLQLMIDSQSIVPAQSAVDADHYDLSDFLPSSLAYFRTASGLQAMPFNISTQVLYFDNGAFRRAGLDPSNPPTTLDETLSAAQKIVSSGAEKYGMSLKLTASNIEQWMAIGDGALLDNGNGRTGRATAVAFDGPLGKTIFEWFGQMVSDKLAQATSGTTYDNLLAIPSKIAPMTIDTSAALGTIASLLSKNQFPGVSLGVGPIPGPSAPGGGVVVGGAGLYLVDASPDERKDAAWQFAKFLLEPTSQATWAAGTGYVPIRQSAVGSPVLSRAWSDVPGYRTAYQQVQQSPADTATAGGLSGAFADVETAIVDALTAMSNGTSPDTALAQAVQASNQAISTYNSRVPMSDDRQAQVALAGVTKRFGSALAVDNLTLDVADGELLVLVGPSGCGKSTVLRLVAGLTSPDDGEVRIAGTVVNDVDPRDRDVAMVFQSYALYPHLDVRRNIEFPLRARKVPADERDRAVTDVAKSLQLEALLDRRPAQLSGGQRQRVALARAMVRHPRAFLMDEPLSNLDAQLRTEMRGELVELRERLAATFLYVTHDQVEAMTMGDRVAVLRSGALQQLGPPQEVHDRPANVFVAGFIGSPPMNLWKATLGTDDAGQLALTAGGPVTLPPATGAASGAAANRDVVIGVRPEDLHIDPTGTLSATVRVVESLGHEHLVSCRLPGGEHAVVRVPPHGVTPRAHEDVRLAVTGRSHLFDPSSGERLGG